MFSGPKIVKDTLFFGYDTGENPNSNFDHTNRKRRHFKGEPITNVVTNTNLDTGWSKGYTSSQLVPDTTVNGPKRISSPVVSFLNASNSTTNSYWYSYGDYAPQVPGQQYTISVYAMTKGKHDFGVRAYTANNSEAGRYWGNMQYTKGDGKWRRFTWTFTNASNSQSDSLSFNLSVPINSTGQRVDLCAPMMNVGDRVRPFVAGDRDNTGSLIDLSPNKHTITVSTSYDSNGLPYFDGTDDSIDCGPITTYSTSDSWTASMIINPTNTSDGSWNGIFGGALGSGGYFMFHGGGQLTYYEGYINSGTRIKYFGKYLGTHFPQDTYKHLVIRYNGNSTYDIFINNDKTNYSYSFTNPYSIRLDKVGGPAGRYGSNRIPVFKFYESALSDSEIKRLYGSYKKRFNL